MSQFVAHPERLLLALDQALGQEMRFIVYGRTAIWLGFDDPPTTAATTQDVDAIVPDSQVQELAQNMAFWDARDAVNEQFKSEGLYITHLFPANQVFLRRQWLDEIVPITRLRFHHLKLLRPATIDLVLTKMMRGNDEQDMADAEFMIRHDSIAESQLQAAFSQMNAIELLELREMFEKAKPRVLQFARSNSKK